ncbi:SDR family NAD(P)-dependent oxidoreductase [Streptomyces sulfonofaciens]|uniref:SDR family NAD(P)-dependent oxidoreductase n=1 Tax=Streptomyces sulfonofaciens TaxID=68272 RepID=UPI0035710512
MSPDDWRLVMSTDVDSCFFGAQAALPHLKQTRGSIVRTASASGLGGERMPTACNAAEGAVVHLHGEKPVDTCRARSPTSSAPPPRTPPNPPNPPRSTRM